MRSWLVHGCLLAFLAVHQSGWSAPGTVRLLAYDATWRYHESGQAPPADWIEAGFDDGSWPSGKGVFAAPANEDLGGHATVGTPLHGGDRPPPGRSIHYFRASFQLEEDPRHVLLVASNLLDDGAIVYLNGHEAGRDGVPAVSGPLVNAELSVEVRQSGPRKMRLSEVHARRGTNVIAVELHQSGSTSSDAVFGMTLWAVKVSDGEPVFVVHPGGGDLFSGERLELEAEVKGNAPMALQWLKDGEVLPGARGSSWRIESVAMGDSGIYRLVASNALGQVSSSNAAVVVGAPGLVPFHAAWRFHLVTEPLPQDWTGPGFDDSSWRTGEAPIGAAYRPGYDPPAKPHRTLALGSFNPIDVPRPLPIVSVFRTWFTWPHPDAVADVTLTTMFDDGGVVHLNGRVIQRVGMIPGPVDFMSQANRRVRNPVLETFSLPEVPLRRGSNVLAVSVHQNTFGSGDMSFALRMAVDRSVEAPVTNPARPAEANVPRIFPRVKLVAVNQLWQFHPADPRWAAHWMDPGRNDIPWRQGRGILAGGFAEDKVQAWPDPVGGDLPEDADALWLRTSFVMPPEAAGGTLWLRHFVNDGARFLLNGAEMFRFNIPHGLPEQSRRARSRVRTVAWSDFRRVQADSVRVGTNWLSVELRRAPGVDRDLAFACELVIEAGAVP